MGEPWAELADRVFVRRHQSLDLNVGLVVGDGACLVIDTRMSHREGRELAVAIRTVTPQPWAVVNTHAHHDHTFGNAVFAPAPIWGHERCAAFLRQYGEIKRDLFRSRAAAAADDDLVNDLGEVEITPPNRTFTDATTLDIGGRHIELHHPGRGHTDHDIVIRIADVTFAGDLVEEGADPVFSDAFPLDWPHTLQQLAATSNGPVVPGHGAVVDTDFVRRQAADLATVADLARHAHATGTQPNGGPFAPHTTQMALERALRQLRGEPAHDSPMRMRERLGLA